MLALGLDLPGLEPRQVGPQQESGLEHRLESSRQGDSTVFLVHDRLVHHPCLGLGRLLLRQKKAQQQVAAQVLPAQQPVPWQPHPQ